MKRRIARKIISDNYHNNQDYFNGSLISIAPVNFGIYHRACVALKKKPYYDKDWVEHINKTFRII